MNHYENNFFFSSLLDKVDYSLSDQSISLLNELNHAMTNKIISYYPSSGWDINDLFYLNKRIKEIRNIIPDIFIHSDFLNKSIEPNYEFNNLLWSDNIIIKGKVTIQDDKKSIAIYKLKTPLSEEFKWLILFNGYFNEDIIYELIRNKIKIPLVYSVCDGITAGQGGCNTLSIPTIFYPLIAYELGLKFMITDQGFDYEYFLSKLSNEFRNWFNNTLLVSNNSSLNELVKLSDQDLVNQLLKRLSAINERSLNKDGKLESYDYRTTDRMVIKKI